MSIKVLTKMKRQARERERESVRACVCLTNCLQICEEYMQSSSVYPLVCMDMKIKIISFTFSIILLCISLFIDKENVIKF